MVVPKVTIRPMRSDDADEVRRLDQLILGDDRSSTWDQQVTRFIELSDYGALPHPSLGCFVALRNNMLAGFLLAEVQAGEYGLPRGMWVVAVGVHPDERRQGIGRMLVEQLQAQCAERGIDSIYAVLRPEDARDMTFLASCGLSASPITVLGQHIGG
ncbi:MAG: N-acetyltransferase [Chloroflexi bacterium]|nr:N-acetyltransferase [Chloroflexota bacterium]